MKRDTTQTHGTCKATHFKLVHPIKNASFGIPTTVNPEKLDASIVIVVTNGPRDLPARNCVANSSSALSRAFAFCIRLRCFHHPTRPAHTNMAMYRTKTTINPVRLSDPGDATMMCCVMNSEEKR